MGLTYDLTLPPVDIDAQPTVCLRVNAEWLGVLMSLTERAEFVRSWVEGTDIERARQNAYKLTSMILRAKYCAENAPPYHEGGETVDDTAPPENGVWYESLADWVIEGFLAVTFTPAAAVVYRTTIPKARILLRTGTLGAAFRILVDGLETLTGSTQGAAGEQSHLITLPNDGLPHDIRIEHAGPPPQGGGGIPGGGAEYSLAIIRGDIRPVITDVRQNETAPCILEKNDGQTWLPFANLQLCPPAIRTRRGFVEYSPDNGVTWIPIETEETGPRYDDAPPPYPEGNPNTDYDSTSCYVAVSLMRWFRQTSEYIGGFASAASFTVAGFLAAKGAAEIMFGGPIGWVAGASQFAGAFGAASSGMEIQNDLSQFDWDALTCIFQNRLSRDDGYIPTGEWEQIAADLDGLNTPVGRLCNFLADLIWVGGARIVAAMGMAGDGNPDQCCQPTDVWYYQPKNDAAWDKQVTEPTGDSLIWPVNEGFRKYSRVVWNIGQTVLISRLWVGGTFRGAAKITVNGIEIPAGGRLQGCYMLIDRPFVTDTLTIECETGTGALDLCHYQHVKIQALNPGGGTQSTPPAEWEICP